MSYRGTTFWQVDASRRFALLFGILLAFASLGQEQTYVVKSRDTLYDIARRKGVSVSELANRNRIDRESRIYVGQRLVIPGATAVGTPSSKLSATVQRAIANAPMAPRRWKLIVIHHAAVDEGNVKSLDRYHREQRHMENGLAYHFLIGNGNGMGDGEIAVGDRWKKQLDGGHLHSEAQNKIALGICLIGNFEKYPPSARQMRSLDALVRALMARCKLGAAAVKTHQQVNVVNTKCPGSKFPTRKFLSGLKTPAD